MRKAAAPAFPLLLTLVLGLVSAEQARAQDDAPRDKAAAQALFDDGRALLAAGDIAGACSKFEESNRINPLPGTLLNLANCHEKLGRLATAWGEYREALALARADGREDRIAFAEERLAVLAPRVPRVTIELAPELTAVTGLVVTRDGVALGPALLGTPLPIDPGTRLVIEARAPGHLPFRVEVTAVEDRAETILIPPLAREQPPPPPLAPAAPPEPPPAVFLPAPVQEAPSESRALRTIGWVTAATGVATALVGMGVGIYALTEESAAEELGCTDTTCPNAEALSRTENANDAAIASNILLPVGATLVGAGVVMLLVPLPSSQGRTGAALTLSGTY